MASLFELERHRRKVYGEMLKTELQQRRAQQRREREELQRRDSQELDQHIQNTRKFQEYKRRQTRDMNQALLEDNMMLTTLKKNASFSVTPKERTPDFISQIHELDGKRIARLKAEQEQQFSQNKDFTTGKRGLQSQLRQLQRTQAERHAARVRQQQIESVRSYQQIKRKHQQDMSLYDKHQKLVEMNDSYRDQIESFTQQPGRGLLQRYHRNQYLQRRASLRDNQEQIVKQMEELDRRRSQQHIEDRQKPIILEESMLASVVLKPQRYEPRAYSNDLRNQMQRDSLRKLEQEREKKEKVEISGIFGGVHGGERHRMIQIIDKRLGIDKYMHEKMEGQRRNDHPEGGSTRYS